MNEKEYAVMDQALSVPHHTSGVRPLLGQMKPSFWFSDFSNRRESGLIDMPILIGVDAMSIGVNSPPTEVGIYARPTISGALLTQQLGRILRPSPETGKDKAIAIQLVDTVKQPRQAPILLPQIFDPEFILRGTRSGLEKQDNGEPTQSAEDPLITISGMKVDTLYEQARTQEMLKKRFTQADITQASAAIDTIVNHLAQEYPGAPFYQIAKEVLTILPERMPKEAYANALQAVASLDPNTQKLGRNLLMWLNLKTAVGLVESYSTVYDSDEERDELLQIAMTSIWDIATKVTNKVSVAQQVHLAVRKGLVRHIAERDNVSSDAAWELEYPKLYSKIIGTVSDIQATMTDDELEAYIESMSDELGVPSSVVSDILYSARSFEQRSALTVEPEENLPENAYDAVELKEIFASVLETLTEREQDVIIKRFGLNGDKRITQVELARELSVSQARIRQIEAKALRKIRHPSRSKHLKSFIDGGVEVPNHRDHDSDTQQKSYMSFSNPPFDYSPSPIEGPPPGIVTTKGGKNRTSDLRVADTSAQSPEYHTANVKSVDRDRDPFSTVDPFLNAHGITDITQLFYYEPKELFKKFGMNSDSGSRRAITEAIRWPLDGLNNLLVSGAYLHNQSEKDWIYHIVEGVMEREDISRFELTPTEQKLLNLAHGRITHESLSPDDRMALGALGMLGQGLLYINTSKKIFHQAYEELISYDPVDDLVNPTSPQE